MSFKKTKRFFGLSVSEKLMFAEALWLLLFSKVVIQFIPFRKVVSYLGELNKETSLVLTESQLALAIEVRTVIFMASANVPWKSVCLDQALTAMVMLNRRNLPNTLYLGVKIDDARKKLDAHAWVKCNDRIMVGGAQSNSFKIVACFSKRSN